MNTTELSDRLIPLSEGRAGIRSLMQIEARVPGSNEIKNQNSKIENPDACVLDFVASDESLDRYNEIISASGWNLSNYQRNPVFQNAHQCGDVLHTLGKALTTEVRSGKLCQRIQFATDINPMAKIAYNLYRGKFLSAVSVGFVPIRWENGTEKTSYNRKFVEQELLEVSAVAIPANPNALALGLKSGAVEKSDLRDCYDLFRLTLERSPDSASRHNEEFLQLALELHRLIKS